MPSQINPDIISFIKCNFDYYNNELAGILKALSIIRILRKHTGELRIRLRHIRSVEHTQNT